MVSRFSTAPALRLRFSTAAAAPIAVARRACGQDGLANLGVGYRQCPVEPASVPETRLGTTDAACPASTGQLVPSFHFAVVQALYVVGPLQPSFEQAPPLRAPHHRRSRRTGLALVEWPPVAPVVDTLTEKHLRTLQVIELRQPAKRQEVRQYTR